MQHLANRILIGVALFVVVVAAMLVVRSLSLRPEVTGTSPAVADLTVKDVDVHEESAGGSRWRLVADQAAVFDAEGRTALKNVRVWVEDKERRWTIVGEEGDFFKASNNLEVRRNVVLTSEDGLRLETAVLRWRAADRRLWTDVPVRIVDQGTVVHGSALDVDVDQEATTVKGRVRATFFRERR